VALVGSCLLACLVACAGQGSGGGGQPAGDGVRLTNIAGRPPDFSAEDATWEKFHSKRYKLTLPLPDGKAWKIDDHRSPELVAVHPPTGSRVAILVTQEEDLMNRQRCAERAERLGWLKRAPFFTTVEDQVRAGPAAYDSRVWVAIDAVPPGGGVEGHAFMFGAFLRRCLLVHFSTVVRSAKAEDVLASRLAIASTRIVKEISVDPLRTTDDFDVPRDKPDIRR
jgi:hypothetical protein